MTTFICPVAQKVTPRFLSDSTDLQKKLYKYYRPLDQAVNVYVLSDGTVVTDLSVVLSDGSFSSTSLPLPMNPMAGTSAGPPEGAEGGPFGPPVPYETVTDATSGVPVVTFYTLNPYLVYWFAGAHGPYPNLSANLVAILTAAKFDNYLI